MKPLNLDEKIVSNEEPSIRLQKKFKACERGITTVEVMVTTGIAVIVGFAAITLFLWILQQFQLITEKNNAQENLLRASYQLRSYLQQAVFVDVVNTEAGVAASSSNPGAILSSYNWNAGSQTYLDTAGEMNARVDLIARFRRETGDSVGSLRDTTLYYQRPAYGAGQQLSDSTYPSGRIFIVDSPSLAPDLSALWFDRFSNFSMLVDVSNGRAKSAQIRLVTRWFKTGSSLTWSYCPQGIACATDPYSEQDFIVNVNFRNNLLRPIGLTGNASGDRLYGSMYFFKTMFPILR